MSALDHLGTPTPEQDSATIARAVESQRDDLRALVATYRLGAFGNDLEALAAPLGPERMTPTALLLGRYLALLLDSLDDGSQDREWRQRTYGEAP